MKLVPPESFSRLCRMYHQDVGEDYPTLDALASYGALGLTTAEKLELSQFLDRLLNGEFNPAEIKALWDRESADISFRDTRQIVEMLNLLRAKL